MLENNTPPSDPLFYYYKGMKLNPLHHNWFYCLTCGDIAREIYYKPYIPLCVRSYKYFRDPFSYHCRMCGQIYILFISWHNDDDYPFDMITTEPIIPKFKLPIGAPDVHSDSM